MAKLLLASLRLSLWYARSFDDLVSEEVIKNHNAEARAARVNKRLLPDDAAAYKAVLAIANEAREAFNANTSPYDRLKVRLMKADDYMQMAERVRKLAIRFDVAVARFVEEYPRLREVARTTLGSMYRIEDYPADHEIRDKFGIQFSVLPFPDAAQYGVDGSEDANAAAIATSVQAEVDRATQAAMRDTWERMYAVVSRFTERLAKPNPRAVDSLVESAGELVDLLPRLNIANDESLTRMGEQVRARLAALNPDAVKQGDANRLQAARQAAELQSIMDMFMTGRADAGMSSLASLESTPARTTLVLVPGAPQPTTPDGTHDLFGLGGIEKIAA